MCIPPRTWYWGPQDGVVYKEVSVDQSQVYTMDQRGRIYQLWEQFLDVYICCCCLPSCQYYVSQCIGHVNTSLPEVHVSVQPRHEGVDQEGGGFQLLVYITSPPWNPKPQSIAIGRPSALARAKLHSLAIRSTIARSN